MNRMIDEHIGYYERQLHRLQKNRGKNPWNRDLLRRQIVATKRILEALRASPEEQTKLPQTRVINNHRVIVVDDRVRQAWEGV